MNRNRLIKAVLSVGAALSGLGLLFVLFVYPSILTAIGVFAALLLVFLTGLIWIQQEEFKQALRTRSVRHGASAALSTGLVLCILFVLNFLNFNHFYRKDLTKAKSNSLSEQTVKLLKSLQQDIKLSVFVKTSERDSVKALMEGLQYQSKRLSIEYIDPDRDPIRAKAANVKKYGTAILSSGKRETRIEELTEEKILNALIKVLKDHALTACFVTGHGEKSLEGSDADGYSTLKAELASQNYESQQIMLAEEGKIPAECSVVLILGPTKAFFPQELKILENWMQESGRLLIAIDPNLKNEEPYAKELRALVQAWGIEIGKDLVLDPVSRMAKVEPTVPIIGIYSNEHSITKDFAAPALFAETSSLKVAEQAPSGIQTHWLAKSTTRAFAKQNFIRELLSGKVSFQPQKDAQGPNVVMAAAEKKGTEQKQSSRLIVLGTSQLANNRWIEFGANSDLFLNAISWLAGDEDLISIRPKEESKEKPSISDEELNYIQFLSILVLPGFIAILGLIVWRRRKKL